MNTPGNNTEHLIESLQQRGFLPAANDKRAMRVLNTISESGYPKVRLTIECYQAIAHSLKLTRYCGTPDCHKEWEMPLSTQMPTAAILAMLKEL